MILVNLYGAPGAGKSTGAAYVFSQLKMAGVNAELITEFAKDKTWEENEVALSNQAYIFGKQYYRITRCMDKVDVIVTDSPLLLSIIYNNDPVLGEDFNKMVKNVVNSFESLNYYIKRVKPYNPAGRNQDEAGSDAIADEVLNMLDRMGIHYNICNGDLDGYLDIVNEVLQWNTEYNQREK